MGERASEQQSWRMRRGRHSASDTGLAKSQMLGYESDEHVSSYSTTHPLSFPQQVVEWREQRGTQQEGTAEDANGGKGCGQGAKPMYM